jgi:acetoin utilization protein AcuB
VVNAALIGMNKPRKCWREPESDLPGENGKPTLAKESDQGLVAASVKADRLVNRAEQKRDLLQSTFEQAAEAQRLNALLVGDVMTRNPHAVCISTTAAQLVQHFHERRFRHFLVVEQGKLVGVISDRDVIRLFGLDDFPERDALESLTAGELMSTDLVTVEAHTTLVHAVGLIVENGISCLPVVENGKAIGILTTTDLYLALELLLRQVGNRNELRVASS